jgi:integrase
MTGQYEIITKEEAEIEQRAQQTAFQFEVAPDGPRYTTPQLEALWSQAVFHWLSSGRDIGGKAAHSRRNYLDALADFWTANQEPFLHIPDEMSRICAIIHYAVDRGAPPWQVVKAHVINWKNDLFGREYTRGGKTRKLSPGTIGLKMSGVASFYKFACEYDIPDPKHPGAYTLLYEKSPFQGVQRPDFSTDEYQRPYLEPDQTRRLIRQIPTDTVTGKMHLALISFYACTGRRNEEVRTMKWGDIFEQGEKVMYKWTGKNHRGSVEDELPVSVWQAIQDYLKAAGRLDMIGPDDYIFVAQSNAAKHFSCVTDWQPGKHPLNSSEVVRVIKVYAKRAGLSTDGLCAHSLRHGFAFAEMDNGEVITELQRKLGHANVATTGRYGKRKAKKVTEAQDRVIDLFGVNDAVARGSKKVARR